MRRFLLAFIIAGFISIFIFSCSDSLSTKLEHQWQLSSITYPGGTVFPVDSVFYSFQNGTAFMFVKVLNPDTSSISYGYTYFPEDNVIRMVIDTTKDNQGNYLYTNENFPIQSRWNGFENQFKMTLTSGNKMELEDLNQIVYTFKKH